MEASNLADQYSLPIMNWDRIEARLNDGISQAPHTWGPERHICWLVTTNPDGSAPVTGIGAMWADGTFWFKTGDRTRKAMEASVTTGPGPKVFRKRALFLMAVTGVIALVALVV